MKETEFAVVEKPSPEPNEKRPRNGFVDAIRILLTQFVIVHHVLSFSYAGYRGFVPSVSQFSDGISPMIALLLIGFNQAYFMGIFFFFSGLFIVGSFLRKGPKEFLKNRFLRFIPPIALYYLVICPIPRLVKTGKYQIQEESDHIWFVILLLTFDMFFAGFLSFIPNICIHFEKQKQIKKITSSSEPFTTTFMLKLLVGSWIGLATSCAIVRIWFPLGHWVPIFGQIFYLPQYVFSFIAGIYADRYNFLKRMPVKLGVWCFYLGLLFCIVTFAGLQLWFSDEGLSFGGLEWMTLYFAIMEQLFAVSFAYGLLVMFKRWVPNELTKKWAIELARASYGAYLIHYTLVLLIMIAFLRVWPEPSVLLLFALVITIIASPLIWTLAIGMRRIPYVKRVVG